MLQFVLDHLGAHKAAYLIPAIVSGVVLTGYTRSFIDARIDIRLSEHSMLVKEKLADNTVWIAGIEDKIDANSAKFLEIELRELRKLYCVNQSARQAIHNQIEGLQRAYKAITGSRYELPDCEIYQGA